MKLSDRNSQQASEYAAKRKAQLDRANRLRQEREAQSVAKQMSSMDLNGRGSLALPSAEEKGAEEARHHGLGALATPSSIRGVATSSYTDRSGASVAERIVVGRDAMAFRDPWEPPPTSSGAPSGGRIMAPPAARRGHGGMAAPEVVCSSSATAVSGAFLTTRSMDNHDLAANSEVYFSSPLDPAGTLFDVSAMPVLCMSSCGPEVIVGCADHALYSIQVAPPTGGGGRARGHMKSTFTTMHGKKHGHSDWITGVCHLADGRALSCGMDNRLCLWNTARTSCVDLPNGHERSISKVVSDSQYNVALSCGYDGNVMAWSFGAGTGSGGLRGAARCTSGVLGPTTTLYGHKSPVVECIFKGSTVASGTKEGSLFFWDLPTGTLLNKHRAHKNGALTALDQIDNSPLFISGGSDGVLKIWDPRCSEGLKGSVARVDVHASSARSTTGVVTSVVCLGDAGAGDLSYIATGGSDGHVVVTDCRASATDQRDKLIPVHRWEHHRAPVSSMVLAGRGGCLFSADAAGMVMCYDILGEDQGYISGNPKAHDEGAGAGIGLRYGLGASSQGGVRTLACAGGKLVAGGDDGNVLVFGY